MSGYFFFALAHLAAMAFLEISFLRRGLNLSALALPPFRPPRRPSILAASDRSRAASSSGDRISGGLAIRSTIEWAIWFISFFAML